MQALGPAGLAEGHEALLADTEIDKGGIERRFDAAHAATIELALDGALAHFRPAVEMQFDDAAILGNGGAGLADILFDQDLADHGVFVSFWTSRTG